jgi:hypothetical protein
MKNQKIKSLESSLLLLAGFITISWGIVGHERINKAAVMALPKPLLVFFTTILILLLKNQLCQICGNMLLQTKMRLQNTISIWRTW